MDTQKHFFHLISLCCGSSLLMYDKLTTANLSPLWKTCFYLLFVCLVWETDITIQKFAQEVIH